jgi:hypothetical protein
MGMGSMTGRGMGYCAGYDTPGYANPGFGMGRGRGFRRMYHLTGLPGWARCGVNPYGYVPYTGMGPVSGEEEKVVLQNQVDYLEKQLSQLRKRMEDLEKA